MKCNKRMNAAYALLATAALVGCASHERAQIQPVQAKPVKSGASEAIDKESFFKTAVLEESTDALSVWYTYKNGIEAEVTYRNNEGVSEIHINVIDDPYNTLTQGIIFADKTPLESSYRHTTIDGVVKKAIKFRIDRITMASIVLDGSEVIVKLRKKSGTEKDYILPPGIKQLGMHYLTGIEDKLAIEAHQRVLDAKSPKTQNF